VTNMPYEPSPVEDHERTMQEYFGADVTMCRMGVYLVVILLCGIVCIQVLDDYVPF